MSLTGFDWEHVERVPYADITSKGIKYGMHEFEAKVTVKNSKTGKDEEATVIRRAEREWMLGRGPNGWVSVTKGGGQVFCLDDALLKSQAQAIYDFVFGEKK